MPGGVAGAQLTLAAPYADACVFRNAFQKTKKNAVQPALDGIFS
jgi:hypothetical protein